MSMMGKRVGVIDMDYAAPGLHVIFDLSKEELKHTLDDVVEGRCSPHKAVINLTKKFKVKKGRLYFVPASNEARSIVSIVRKSLELSTIESVINGIASDYSLDYVLIDSRPGINQFSLLALGISDLVLLVARLDRQDISGSEAILQVTKALSKRVQLVASMVPTEQANKQTERKLAELFNLPVLAIIPYEPDVQMNWSSGVFMLKQPNHNFSVLIRELASRILRLQEEIIVSMP